MKRLAIVGAGDLGQQIAYYAIADKQYDVVGFFDDFAKNVSEVNDIKILGTIAEIEAMFSKSVFDELIIGIGYKHLSFREEIFNKLKNKVNFATFIHSSCYIDSSCIIGKGVCLFPKSVLDCNVVIEDNVLINISCIIAHDSTIQEHTFLSPSVSIAGFVSIGKRCNIGINTTIIDNINLSKDIQTGGGTVITESIGNKGLYVGNPARFIR